MTLTDAFIDYLQTSGVATFGQDLFTKAPSSNDKLASGDPVPDALWWLTVSGGNTETKLVTGEKIKSYLLELSYRNRDAQVAQQKLHDLDEQLNCAGCVELSGFDVREIEASAFPVDQDWDREDRFIGLLQVTVSVYSSC